MTTVVTGASGFLGGAVVRALLDRGRTIRAVDLHRGPTLEGLDVEFVRGDVLDRTSLDHALDGADVVYHLAAMISITGDPDGRVRRLNVEGVRNTAASALQTGVRRMVHCSSVHAYDLTAKADMITEESMRATSAGLPPYDRSKAAGESALRDVVDAGLDAVVANPTGIIGTYDHAPSRMGRVFMALFDGSLPALVDGGFDWVDSRDVALGLIAAEEKGRTAENYLLPGHWRSLHELAQIAETASEVPRPKRTVPMWLARLWGPVGDVIGRRTGDDPLAYTSESLHALRHSPRVSGAKAVEELGYTNRPIEETIADTYRWFETGA